MILARKFAILSLLLFAAQSQAHFIWAEYRATNQRKVVVTFAENPGESVLDIMGKVGPQIAVISPHTQKESAATPTAAYFPWLGTKGVFLGSMDYGVVDHGQGAYFLKYWFKAVSRPIQASKAIGKGLEIVAEQGANAWSIRVLRDGKPCPEAEIVLGSDEKSVKVSAKNAVSIQIPESPMAIPVKASLAIKRTGKFNDKAFTLEKDWTTLVLPAVSRATTGADPTAYVALQNATLSREGIAKGAFAFQCSFVATNGTKSGRGSVNVSKTGDVTVTVEGLDEGLTKHVKGQVQSLFFHRFGGTFAEGKNPITWTKDGRISVNDQMKSFYTLKNGALQTVERTFGENVLTLIMKNVVETPWGGTLSKEFLSIEKNAKTGAVNNQLVYRDEFLPYLDEWMPKSRTVTGTVGKDKIWMNVVFSDYRSL